MANGIDIISSAAIGPGRNGAVFISQVAIQIGDDALLQRGVILQVATTNAGVVFVGFQPTDLINRGFPIFPSAVAGQMTERLEIPIDNMNKLYFIADTDAQVLYWIAI